MTNEDEKLDKDSNGNIETISDSHRNQNHRKKPFIFKKTSQLFAHRKQGAQQRFEKVYLDLKDKICVAWLKDLESMETEFHNISKNNQALATTKITRTKELAEQTIRETISTVFDEWRVEIARIISELGGYPQEDGNVLFPDGSIAKIPKGLYISPENKLQL